MSKTRICLWSGPRNISTALMYGFAQRSDTQVFDEPLYAHYLSQSSAKGYHPGATEVLASMENDGEKVVREVILGVHTAPVLFFKLMAHHLLNLENSFLLQTVNILLTRDPAEMLPSYAAVVENPSLDDVGYAKHLEIFNFLKSQGEMPIVLDAKQVLLNPEKVLRKLCERINIVFDQNMLSWRPGARTEDGVWAKYWYHNVHRSAGFSPYTKKTAPFPAHLKPLLAQCQPYYEQLQAMAVQA